MKIANVVVDYWDGTAAPFNGVEVHIPTPGIYRFMVPGAGNFTEIPFSSIKFLTVTPQE